MTNLYQVDVSDVEQLEPWQLARLMGRLVESEAIANQIPASGIDFSSNISASDGGSDLTISWKGGPPITSHLPSRHTVFQFKATGIAHQECAQELFGAKLPRIEWRTQETKTSRAWKPIALKSQVKECFEREGAYVIVTREKLTPQAAQARLTAMQRALQLYGSIDLGRSRIGIFGADQIASWINENISAVAMVFGWRGRTSPLHVQTLEAVSKYSQFIHPYVRGDATRDSQLTSLREWLTAEKRIARIEGLPGIGKTRFVLEALRHQSDDSADFRIGPSADSFRSSPSPVFVDANDGSANVCRLFREWRGPKLRGIVIVENCDDELHELLCKEVRHQESHLSLVSIGPELDVPLAAADEVRIKLVAVDDAVIRGMLRASHPTLWSEDLDFIVREFAQGYPQMATLVAEARLNSQTLHSAIGKPLLEKLIGLDTSQGSIEYKVISACAAFSRLGIEEEYLEQRKIVASKICRCSHADFYSAVSKFLKRGILSKKGRFVTVRPRPLAIRLAADWWTDFPPDDAQRLFEDKEFEPLIEPMCEQIRMLDTVPAVRDVAERLCGPSGPFGRAEALNSESGSRLFRSLAEVAPESALRTLVYVTSHWDESYLKHSFGPGRRQIVWLLERLAYRASMFSNAAGLLLRLAAAENETWSNNATGIVLQLFHALNSGTEAHFEQRLAFLRELWATGDDSVRKVLIRAAGAAIEAGSVTRSVGAEFQGSGPPLVEFRPKTYGEIYEYWSRAIALLHSVAIERDPFADLAQQEIAQSIRSLVLAGQAQMIEPVVVSIAERRRCYWPAASDVMRIVMQYDFKKLRSADKDSLQRIIAALEPIEFEDRLRQLISLAPYEHVENGDGRWRDVSSERAAALAAELRSEPEHLFNAWHVLFEGTQRQGFAFGAALAESEGAPSSLVDRAIRTLESVRSDGNPIVLAGILSVLRKRCPKVVTRALDDMAEKAELVRYLPFVTSVVAPRDYDIQRLVRLLRSGALDPVIIYGLSQGQALANVSPTAIEDLCDALLAHGGGGASSALDVLMFYCFGDDKKWHACKSIARRVVMAPQLLASIMSRGSNQAHEFEVIALRLLSERDGALADALSKTLFSRRAIRRSNGADWFGDLYCKLLSDYFDEIWRYLGARLTSKDPLLALDTRFLLSDQWGGRSGRRLIECAPVGKLMEWCRAHRDRGPVSLLEVVPVFRGDDAEFSDMVLDILQEYGDRKEVLAALSVNMNSFGWMGSAVPMYERISSALQRLTGHRYERVRTWARNSIDDLEHQTAREKLRMEEEGSA